MSNGEIIFHLKRIFWKGCVITRERVYIYYYQIQGWKILHMFVSFWEGPKYRAQKQLCSNTLKRNELKVYIFLRVINWHAMQIAKAHFKCTI